MISDALKTHLRAVTDPEAGGRYLLGGVAVAHSDREAVFLTGRAFPDDAARDRPEWVDRRVRVASISKAITARLVLALVATDAFRTEDDIGLYLSDLGYPDWVLSMGVRISDLMTHCSGLTDRAGYFADLPTSLAMFLSDEGEAVPGGWPPGGYFFYSNLNYVLLGALCEAATGERFDRLVSRHVLEPLGLAGTFNWCGADEAARRGRLPLYQRYGDRYSLEVDGTDGTWSGDLIWRNGVGMDLGGYRLGHDTYLFSPHAGYRGTLPELARLALAFGSPEEPFRRMAIPKWQFDGENGAWSSGLFPAVGLGLTVFEDPATLGRRLIGHAGHALGFTGGAWYAPDDDFGFAYFLTGSADETEGSEEESFFSADEIAIFRAI